jgi:hypothetical protein
VSVPPADLEEDAVHLRPLIAAAAVAVLAGSAVTAGAAAAPKPAAKKSPQFAPAATATVKPGVQTLTQGAQCTANFVFVDGAGAVYLGQSAHCAGTGEATQTNGCQAGSLPLGTPVTVRGASKPGVLAYSSWVAMQRAGEKDVNACRYNDFALIRLDPSDVGRTNPSVPVFGGPVGQDVDGTNVGERVHTFGNSSLRLGLGALSPKRGVSIGTSGQGWTHSVYTATPGVPGDSGSAVLDSQGKALGTLSTLALAPFAGSNGVSDLSRQLDYARSHGMSGLALVNGTESFRSTL